MRVELHQEHTDVVQQWLASVCIPHLGQLPQVTQLETAGLGMLKCIVRLTNTQKGIKDG